MTFKKVLLTGAGAGVLFGSYRLGLSVAEADHHDYEAKLAASKRGQIAVYHFPIAGPSNKVMAYLEFHGIPHSKTAVSYFTKKELLFSQFYKLVPVALINGQQVDDSTVILRKLQKSTWTIPFNSRAMGIIDDEVLPAISATCAGNPLDFIMPSPLLEKVVLGAYTTVLLPMKGPQKWGEHFDKQRLVPALEKAFRAVSGFSLNPRTSVSEVALFGALRPVRHMPEVQAALEELGKVQWYDNIQKVCEQRRKIITSTEMPRSKCPFAKGA
eukprot:TRINITY_DN18201_c0_g1_i1.p1 TRINITY_DN18201_c0_g1~~TRINITY_DN18201_c0_g1_i1.p1  ORF type:complete len:270 (+),score=129.90 TRINITY_DN18201_c0_g1_i1:49-858(+)